MADWPSALAEWSPWTQLRPPQFFLTDREASGSAMAGQIAAINLVDQTVMVNLQTVARDGLETFSRPVLAHEIGHHIFVPGNLGDNARMLAVIRRELGGLRDTLAPMVANLWGDLLINDRLQPKAEDGTLPDGGPPDIAGVYRLILRHTPAAQVSRVWQVYTRAYEHLWRTPHGEFCPGRPSPDQDADARLVARLVRSFSRDWIRGARRFACLLWRWLSEDEAAKTEQTLDRRGLADTRDAGRGADGTTVVPDGLAEIDPAELEELGDLVEELEDAEGSLPGRRPPRGPIPENTAPDREGQGSPGRQFREPFQYGELLKALGLNLSLHDVTTRYYRERALPWLVPFPERPRPRTTEPVPEGHEGWEATDPIEALDVAGSISRNPVLIPGMTTLQRTWGESPGQDPARQALDLDLYVDCSGSMPNPARQVSYLALAGAILALSALRAGASVQATLWSGAGQFDRTPGFVRDEDRILGVLTGYLNGGTAFPLSVLRDTWQARRPDDPPGHIVVISDDGVDTMMARDEKNRPGIEIAQEALERARGGGTLVLNMQPGGVKRLAPLEEAGFRIHAVQNWEHLVSFARAFVLENYGAR